MGKVQLQILGESLLTLSDSHVLASKTKDDSAGHHKTVAFNRPHDGYSTDCLSDYEYQCEEEDTFTNAYCVNEEASHERETNVGKGVN